MFMRISTMIIILLLLSACGTSHDKTGEVMLLNSDKLKVKVVQIYKNVPLSYYGLTHEIWCQSPNTMDIVLGRNEKGWNHLGYSGITEPGQSPSKEIQKKALDAAVQDANQKLRIINDQVIIFSDHGITTVTINGCKSFSTWNGWDLPEGRVVQAVKPSYCKESKCQWENFRGDNEISFTDIQIDAKSKNISFRAHSKAFKDGDLLVQSADGGIHWAVTEWQRKK